MKSSVSAIHFHCSENYGKYVRCMLEKEAGRDVEWFVKKKKICLEKAGESAASQALLYISVGFEF